MTGDGAWWSPWREAGDSVILHVDLRPDPEREERALALLDDQERARWNRYVVEGARRRYALCRAALRSNLCDRLGCSNRELSFGYGKHGKPFALVNGVPSDASFNVSHSGRHGLIAFARSDGLGVDLEVRAPGRDFDGIGGNVYGPRERLALSSTAGWEKADLFYRFWSLKEALIKALGTGFSLSPSLFEVPGPMIEGERSSVFRFPHLPSDRFWLEDLGEPRFAAARAYRLVAGDAGPSGRAGGREPGSAERGDVRPGALLRFLGLGGMRPDATRPPRRRLAPALRAALPVLLAVAAGPVAEISAQTTELRRGRPVAGTLAAGDTVRYTVQADENDFVLGEVDQISVDVTVRVLDPEGRQVARFGGLGRGPERFGGETSATGVFTVELFVAGDEEEASGDYEITLLRHERVATDPRKLADQLMARFDGDRSPGAAVRVWRDGRTLFSKTYGMANLAYGIPFGPDTRTNIGSTSKQFTAFAVMLQAERGLLSLDDDIRTHIPELPEFDDTVRVRHLVTHTSGLREFLNLLRMTGRRLDLGDWIDRSEIIEIVQRQPALQNVPGAEWNYNNTAYGLAAVIVERTSGQDFHVFMLDHVFGPLGMTGTMVRPSIRHMVPNQSEGYTPTPDGYMQIGDLGAAVGAGGMYSTIGDLQTWVENYADPRVGTRESIDEMMTSFVLTNGEETGYGYGVFVDEQRGLKRVQHGGADVAHRSMLVYYPEINAGITTQSNHAQFGSNVAFELAEAFFEDAMEPEEGEDGGTDEAGEFDPEGYDSEGFDEFVGRYALDAAPSFVLTFTREGDSLYVQATGQPRLDIVPTSDSTFRLLVVEASVTFLRGEEDEVEGAILHQNGDRRATRLPDDEAPEEWAPTEGELADYAGRFFSEEIETFYTFEVDEGELVVRQRRLGRITLEPGEKDEFAGGGFSFAFERDRNGEVTGFYLSNVRTRDVRFGRVG